MSRICTDGHIARTAAKGVLGGLVAMLLIIEPASAAQKKLKKITHDTYALSQPHFFPGADKKSKTGKTQAGVGAKSKQIIFGRAAWVCTPSGFGRKASCVARSTFG